MNGPGRGNQVNFAVQECKECCAKTKIDAVDYGECIACTKIPGQLMQGMLIFLPIFTVNLHVCALQLLNGAQNICVVQME